MSHPFLLSPDSTALLVVDIQERLAAAMENHEKERVYENIKLLVFLAKRLHIPILVTQQYTKGLGPTVAELAEALEGTEPLEKITFSCCGDNAFNQRIKELGVKNLLITGMEAHICVLQTALDCLNQGYQVQVAADAVCSREPQNKTYGLEFMRHSGVLITTTESALYQLLGKAGTEDFKAVLAKLK